MTKRMTKEDRMRVFYETLGSIDYHLTMADKLMISARKQAEIPEEYNNAFREMVERLQKTQSAEATIRHSIAMWFREQGRKYIRKTEDAQ